MTTSTIPYDDKDAILARADEIRAEDAAAAAAEAVAKFAPLLDLLASPAFAEVRAAAAALSADLVMYPRIYSALESLPRQMDLIGMFVPPEARPSPSAP